MNHPMPVRILIVLMIITMFFVNVAWATADSTLAAVPVETERATKAKAGMRAGAIAGSIAGTAFFLLVGAVANSLCEYDCPDVTTGGFVGLGVLGAITGAATGALLGGLFGSMIPDHSKSSPSQTETPFNHKSSIASVSIETGLAVLTERPENEAGLLLRATLVAQLNSWLGAGPEVTYGDLAGGMLGIRGAFYLGPRQPGLRPYLVTALGWQHWKTGAFDTDVGVLEWGTGGGLAWTPGLSNTHIGLEARYEFSPQNIDQNEYFRFVSTSAVLRHSW
jgi:hypothetical protein